MLGPVLASFQRVEIERVEEIFECVGDLYRMGKIDRDAAVALLKREADQHLYHSSIGRNVNFRFRDHSSVWRNPNRMRYVKRLFAKDGDPVVERIGLERTIFQNQTHDQLANFHLFHEIFGDSLRIIEMIRHPVDLVDSWLRRGWGTRFGNDPLAFDICISYDGENLPYYALGFEAYYIKASPVDRVIRMITRLLDDSRSVYGALTQELRSQVLVLPFEEFVQRPYLYLPPIADFIGSSPTRHTPSALKRQRCPRTISPGERQHKQKRIESEASTERLADLNRLTEEYERLVEATGVAGA